MRLIPSGGVEAVSTQRRPNHRLLAQRKRRDWARIEMAQELETVMHSLGETQVGVDENSIYRWEAGLRTPGTKYRRGLRALFGCSNTELGFPAEDEVTEREDEDERHHAQWAGGPSAMEDAELGSTPAGLAGQPPVPGWALDSGTLIVAPRLWSAVQRSTFLHHLMTTIIGGMASPVLNAFAPDSIARVAAGAEGSSPVDAATVGDMALASAAYRRGYRQLPAHILLPQAIGHMRLTVELLQGSRSSDLSRQLLSVIAESAMLAGTLSLHDLYDFDAARLYYQFAGKAIRESDDRELKPYLLGCMSFTASYGGNLDEAVALSRRSEELAAKLASPKTQAWLHAVAAETYATAQQETAALSALDSAREALERTDQPDTLWIGIGAFDHAKLAAYTGTCYVRLNRPKRAYEALTEAVTQLNPSFLKHQCTALADLATALVGMTEIDEACRRAGQSLAIASQIQHGTSIRRIRNLRDQMRKWEDAEAVKCLDEELLMLP